MNPITGLFIIGVVGWLLFILAWLLFAGARRVNRDWRKLCEAKDETIRDLERQRLIGVQADPDGLKWYREENTRLSRKCAAICSQIRKMKGRGNGSCQINPIHNF